MKPEEYILGLPKESFVIFACDDNEEVIKNVSCKKEYIENERWDILAAMMSRLQKELNLDGLERVKAFQIGCNQKTSKLFKIN